MGSWLTVIWGLSPSNTSNSCQVVSTTVLLLVLFDRAPAFEAGLEQLDLEPELNEKHKVHKPMR